MNRLIRGASLSFVAVALMVLTSFVALSTPSNNALMLAYDSALTNRLGGAGVSLNADVEDPDAKLDAALVESMSMSRGPFKVYVIINDRDGANDVLASLGQPLMAGKAFDGVADVQMMELGADAIEALADSSAVDRILLYQRPTTEPADVELAKEDIDATIVPGTEDYDVDVVHGAAESWDLGYTGQGVLVADIDTGFDMAHPDLQGQQARYESGTYAGWPMAYDDYAAMKWSRGEIGGWVADTSAEVSTKGKKSGTVLFDGVQYIVKGIKDADGNVIRSKSGVYHIGYHTDGHLEAMYGAPVAVLVVDANMPGVYDTVYVDVTNDLDFSNDKPCTKGDEISYFDYYDATTGTSDYSAWNAGDGYADLSGGMIYWISDGETVYPASDWTYGATFKADSGDAVAFVGEFYYGESHGTMTSSAVLAKANSMDGLLVGMAPGAKLIAIPFTGSIVNAWLFAEYGVDGVLGTGDEADVCTNSYGWSDTTVDAGYNDIDMTAVSISMSGPTMWCWSAGNGGPGYGTAHSTTDFTSIHVGAGTTMQYRYRVGYEMSADYWKWGDVIPFSNSGPGRNGKLHAEIIASGAYSLQPAPLNSDLNINGALMTAIGDGSMHYQIGSGTSHATPTVAGGMALGFQAYMETTGGFPEKDLAKAAMMASAEDMHYDAFKQASGWLNAATFCKYLADQGGTLSMSKGPNFMTSALYPGDVYGTSYEAFPNFMVPGAVDTELVTTVNKGDEDTTIDVSGSLPIRTGSETIQITTKGQNEVYVDVTSLIPEGTQLLKATMYCPMEAFDPELDSAENFAYGLEFNDWVDLNGNGKLDAQVKSPGVWELFRFTVDGETCNYCVVDIKDPLERITDGLIIRVRPWTPAVNVVFDIQLDFYTLQEFPWAQFREAGTDNEFASSLTLTVPAKGEKSWEVRFSVPEDAPVGSYGAGVYIDDGSRVQCMPVLINVPATTYEFEFGGESYFDTPYNNDIKGVSDKYWRFEVGDWRIYWCLPDPSLEMPSEDAYMMAAVEWTELPTDINVHVLGPTAADASDPLQSMFCEYGPGYYEYRTVSSDERYMGGGVFGYYTNTGGPKEVVASPIGACLNELGTPAPFAILTRCPLMAGHSASDTLRGYTRWVDVNGFGAATDSVELSIADGVLSGTIPAWYDITVDGVLDMKGMGQPTMQNFFWPAEEVYPDPLSGNFDADLAAAAYTMPLTVTNCNKLTVSVAPVSGCEDIDLGVWYDENMDGIADLTEPYWYVGTGGSYESLTLLDPDDGQYLVKVLGYTVTGDPGIFSLTVLEGVAGAVLEVVPADETVGTGYHEFDIEYTMPAAEGVYMGAVTFGFEGTADMFEIDVMFTVTP